MIMKRIGTPLAIGLAVALLVSACGNDVVDAGPVAGEPEDEAPAETEEPDESPAEDTQPEEGPEAPEEEETSRGEEEPTREDEGEEAEEPADGNATTKIQLYYIASGGENPARPGPFLVSVEREIPSTPRIALATLRELVDGPTSDEAAKIDGLASSVPDGTLVLGVTITDGLATVDLSREFESGGGSFSMFTRLAQVIYTVTQFPTVDEVAFLLDGRPVTVFSGEGIMIEGPAPRSYFVDYLPGVFVDRPAAGASIRSGERMTGMAAVFEAEFQYRLEGADGTVLAEGFAMTDHGQGWGSFDHRLEFDVRQAQSGTLTVWEYSAKDGSVQSERVTPLTLLPS
jgi:germination protein M